jgi:hypothetical protein
MFTIPCLFLLATAPEERPSAFGRENDVVLEVRVLEMVEGGPVTIEAVLTNKGSTLDMPGYMKARHHADYIYRSAPSTTEAHQLFIDQLTRDKPPTIAPYFDKLLELGSVGFTADQIRRLEQVPDLWMRAFTYVALGNLCDPEWVKRVLADLEHSQDPLNRKVLNDLVLRLDADRWRVREAAYRELMAYGTRVRGGLRKAAKPSREVAERIEKLLEHIDKTPPDPRDVAAFEWLRRQAPQAGHPWPERCRQVLDSLSRADHSSWIAAEAQKLLAGKLEREERHLPHFLIDDLEFPDR